MDTTEIDAITTDVLHSAVHDLFGPANRLRLLAQLLSRSGVAGDEEGRKLLGHIDDSAAAVGVVADGLKKYAEVCTRTVRRQRLNLRQPLDMAIEGLQSEIASIGAKVTPDVLPEADADPFMLTWLFRELVTNALRARAADAPMVCVSAAEGGPGGWFVSVLDNGPGIEPSMAERVFRPFKKMSAGKGAGLGLTICRRIVEMHGGRIWVEPHAGGADIRFFLSSATSNNNPCL